MLQEEQFASLPHGTNQRVVVRTLVMVHGFVDRLRNCSESQACKPIL